MNRVQSGMLRYVTTIVVALSFFLASCGNGGKNQEKLIRENKFADEFPFSLNSELELTLIEPQPPVSPDQKIVLTVKNKTSNCVVFPANYGIKILSYNDNIWQGIPNLVNYLPDEKITLTPEGDIYSARLVFVFPDMKNVFNSQNLEIRILVAGLLCNSNSQIGAFTDVVIGN